uniref:PLAC8 like 2 n=1 Tax=Gallus gallus TaxID=9031 RepID=A0A8V0XII3_CHICK
TGADYRFLFWAESTRGTGRSSAFIGGETNLLQSARCLASLSSSSPSVHRGCCGLFCFPCLACTVAGDMNECCLCGTSVAMRTMYRTRYNIPGSICSDFCITSCCPVCSVCQIKRDINRRRAMGIF